MRIASRGKLVRRMHAELNLGRGLRIAADRSPG
jgi:hypothetical protein